MRDELDNIQDALFQVPAQIMEVNAKPNKLVKMKIETQENLTESIVGRLASMAGKMGWFTFSVDKEIKPEDLLDLPALKFDKSEKSPSIIMRNVLYILWEQKGKPTDTFDEFYRRYMEKIINQIKDLLT